jgi:hypothetical protein
MPLSSAATDAATARLAAVKAALPGLVTGFWLTGSATSGDWWPGVSDVDVVASLARPLTPDELPALAAAAAGLPVDGLYLPAADLADPPSAGEPVPHVVNGEFSAGPCGEATPVTWLELRQRGVPLRGPAPAELVPEPNPAAVRDWLLGNLRGYWSAEADEREQILTARPADQPARAEGVCWLVLGAPRLHATLATGEVISKTAAGQYAARRWPDHLPPRDPSLACIPYDAGSAPGRGGWTGGSNGAARCARGHTRTAVPRLMLIVPRRFAAQLAH